MEEKSVELIKGEKSLYLNHTLNHKDWIELLDCLFDAKFNVVAMTNDSYWAMNETLNGKNCFTIRKPCKKEFLKILK